MQTHFSLNPMRVATLTHHHQSLPLIVNTGHLEAVGPCSWAAFHRCSVTGLEVVSLISHIWKGRCIGLLPSLLHWACVASSIFWVHGKKRFREGRQHGHWSHQTSGLPFLSNLNFETRHEDEAGECLLSGTGWSKLLKWIQCFRIDIIIVDWVAIRCSCGTSCS